MYLRTSPFAVLMSQKKSSFGNFFPANQHGKSTADQLLMSQNCPKIFASIWWPFRNPSEISESFEKISTANQQQINRAITELDFFWDINTANGDIRNQSIIKQLIKQVIKSCLLLRICMNNIY